MQHPVVKQLNDNGSIVWEASGLGIVVRHSQQWQAELHWLFICKSKGLDLQKDQ